MTATSLALAVAAEATAAGAWLAVVDVPWLGVEAAAELGVPLERLVRVDPDPVEQSRGAGVGRPDGGRARRVRAGRHPGAGAGRRRATCAGCRRACRRGGRSCRWSGRPGVVDRRHVARHACRRGRASPTATATCGPGGWPSSPAGRRVPRTRHGELLAPRSGWGHRPRRSRRHRPAPSPNCEPPVVSAAMKRVVTVWWPDWPVVAAGAADGPAIVLRANRVVARSMAGGRRGRRHRPAPPRRPAALSRGRARRP